MSKNFIYSYSKVKYDLIYIIDESSMDTYHTKSILISENIGAEIKIFSEIAYALAEMHRSEKLAGPLPDLILINIDFNNIYKFIEFYNYIETIPDHKINLIPMAALADKKLFKPLIESGIDLMILKKSINSELLVDHLLKFGSSLKGVSKLN